MATGWGTTSESGDVSTILQEVKLPMMSLANCDKNHANVKVTQTMICAGGVEGEDACQGDSGGPMIYKDESAESIATLLGATSWGVGCARAGLPGVCVEQWFSKWGPPGGDRGANWKGEENKKSKFV